MKSTKTKYTTLITGLLVAVLIILSQSSYLKQHSAEKAASETSAGQDDSERTCLPTISVTSLPGSPVVSFTNEAICLFEIIYADREAIAEYLPDDLPVTRFFSTLLSIIISPNAP
jgi:hypothetical protein